MNCTRHKDEDRVPQIAREDCGALLTAAVRLPLQNVSAIVVTGRAAIIDRRIALPMEGRILTHVNEHRFRVMFRQITGQSCQHGNSGSD